MWLRGNGEVRGKVINKRKSGKEEEFSEQTKREKITVKKIKGK